jgi:site-specific recombinase XerD
VSEVTSLNLEDIKDLSSPPRAKLIVTRKGPKQQVIALTADVRYALRKWLRVRPVAPTPALFSRLPFHPHRGLERLKYYSLEKIFRHYAAKAGLPLKKGQSFHVLRHSAAQALADDGVPTQDIQALLGHADIKTTLVYFTMSDARVRQTVERLQHALCPEFNPTRCGKPTMTQDIYAEVVSALRAPMRTRYVRGVRVSRGNEGSIQVPQESRRAATGWAARPI